MRQRLNGGPAAGELCSGNTIWHGSERAAVIVWGFAGLGAAGVDLGSIEHRRRLHLADITAHPTRTSVAQQARNLATKLGTRMEALRFLLRDRDTKFIAAFDVSFESAVSGSSKAHHKLPPGMSKALRREGRSKILRTPQWRSSVSAILCASSSE